MPEYTVEMRDEQCSETETFEAGSASAARKEARRLCREWVRGGSWGIEGAAIEVRYTVTDEDGDEVDSDYLVVEVEPDHDALIKAAGGDPNCDHDWIATMEAEGGCDSNPGVWSHGGTALTVQTHCRHCGLQRTEHITGSQRNPGEHDTVEYHQPDSWCSECEREECECE